MVKPVRPALKPFGQLYAQVMDWRNRMYDKQWLETIDVGCPVVSVGNITAGGTGKTPVVMSVVERLKSMGLRPAVVSRGYKGNFTGVQQVTLDRKNPAKWYGDEPVLIKTRFPEVPVFVGIDRVLAAREAMSVAKPDVLVADDAFQHRRLARKLDILVIDSTQDPESMLPLPWGLGREAVSGLKRAQLVVLTKVNLSSAELMDAWSRAIKSSGTKAEVMRMAYRSAGLFDVNEKPILRESIGSVMVTAAIGQPEAFVTLIERELGLTVRDRMFFADHHFFKKEDLNRILRKMDAKENLFVTEKDAVKIKAIDHPLLERLVVVPVKPEWLDGTETLDDALANCTT